ncbi:hypothetical protein PF010_g8014 [Phytophthora fragariae]|uniref:Uncharacterized protein n=1 Tax=Phytophthora fragariae TaxID=53985 RepID=A0A6G0LH08_9STRA|nr:hypothetical protein PF010_g8014 [Phytophthora fragariae]
MVYSSSRVGSRTLIKAAVVCALSLSAMPSASAQYSLDASTATDVDVCGISDGDKSVGIRVIDDSSCASGGLGCYNEHCRFCKILETPQSSVYENCKTFDVDFPTMAPLVASTGTCEVSSGDAAVGISAVTDASCLYGGLGCFNDHCRYCKMFSSVQGPLTWTAHSSLLVARPRLRTILVIQTKTISQEMTPTSRMVRFTRRMTLTSPRTTISPSMGRLPSYKGNGKLRLLTKDHRLPDPFGYRNIGYR